MKIKSLPKEERPVEKSFSKGIESLSNGELLAAFNTFRNKRKIGYGIS